MSPFYAFHTARGQARLMLACTGSISLFCFATTHFFHFSILDVYFAHMLEVLVTDGLLEISIQNSNAALIKALYILK
jgi:hypothetical protein